MKSAKLHVASYNVGATEFQYKEKRMLALALALAFSSMIGVVYALIAEAMGGRREAKA